MEDPEPPEESLSWIEYSKQKKEKSYTFGIGWNNIKKVKTNAGWAKATVSTMPGRWGDKRDLEESKRRWGDKTNVSMEELKRCWAVNAQLQLLSQSSVGVGTSTTTSTFSTTSTLTSTKRKLG